MKKQKVILCTIMAIIPLLTNSAVHAVRMPSEKFLNLHTLEGQAATASIFYVDLSHPSASDNNPGTEDSPWLTIQHAADAALPGDIIYVKPGIYDERVVIQNSGTPEVKITIAALPRRSVLTQGFHIDAADNIRIVGFRITNELTKSKEQIGIIIEGSGIEVIGNEFFDLKASAIQGLSRDHIPTSVYIADNYIEHCQKGIVISGDDWLVENNEIKRLFKYSDHDVDYMRFFGDNHVIRGNYLHGTDLNETGDAHVDCFQTFDNNGEYGHNILIEGNVCHNFGQVLMAEARYHHNISHITIRNNEFAHGRSNGLIFKDISYVTVQNNTFVDIRYHGTAFRGESHHNLVVNNIYYNIRNCYLATEGASVSGDYNLVYETKAPPIAGDHDLIGVDPLFINPSNDNYHLQSGSPAIDTGDQIPEVIIDIEGTSRPQGNGYDIGAYEFKPEGPLPTFADVPFDYWAHDEIEALYQAGYTAGCATNPLRYCPDDTMTHEESAVYIVRGVHTTDFAPPQPTIQVFADVALDRWSADWIDQLWNDGYTAGCGTDPLIYCPERKHDHAEATVFYLRMMYGVDYLPPDPAGIFVDVPLDHWAAGWIEAAYNAGLIPACETEPDLKFCPDKELSRAMAAYMMVQAKDL